MDLSCEMAGAKGSAASACPRCSEREVRVIPAPCVGRCEQAPVAVVHQKPVPHATIESVQTAVQAGHIHHEPDAYIEFEAYCAARRLRAAARLHGASARCRERVEDHGGFRTARPRRRRFPDRPQVAHRARRARAAADGGQHRRRRARHVQGPLVSRARSAPFSRRDAHRGLGRRYFRDLHLPAR